MAEVTIRLRCDPTTGKKDIVIALRSDPDALPQEHEQLHRSIVEQVLGKGILTPDEIGRIVVERETAAQPSIPSASNEEPDRQAEAAGGERDAFSHRSDQGTPGQLRVRRRSP